MSVRLSTPAFVVLEAAEADVAAAPRDAVAVDGIGFLKASKNAGVPKVSVRAIASTCYAVSGQAATDKFISNLTPAPNVPSQYLNANSFAFS